MLYYQLGFYFFQGKYIESNIIKSKSYYMKEEAIKKYCVVSKGL